MKIVKIFIARAAISWVRAQSSVNIGLSHKATLTSEQCSTKSSLRQNVVEESVGEINVRSHTHMPTNLSSKYIVSRYLPTLVCK